MKKYLVLAWVAIAMLAIVPVWAWALFGMSEEVGLAWMVTFLVALAGGFALSIEEM